MLDWGKVWIAKAGEPPACAVPVRGGVPPSGWMDRKTTKEVGSALHDKFRVKQFIANETEDMVKKGNVIGEELTRIFANNPRLSALVKESKKVLNSIDLVDKKFLENGIIGRFDPKVDKIQVAVRGAQTKSANFRLGKGLVDSSLRGTVRHEYGHYVRDVLHPERVSKGWWGVWEAHSGEEWAKTVSVYAKTNASEAWAESFAVYTHPTYGQPGIPRLPIDVESFMKKVVTGP